MNRQRRVIYFWPIDVVKRLITEGTWYKLLKQDIKRIGSAKEIEWVFITKRKRMIPANRFILKYLLSYQRKRKAQKGRQATKD